MSHDKYELATPFFIDTDGYTARDREMFCAGFEFAEIRRRMIDFDCFEPMWIQPENESRVRMLCGRHGYTCNIVPAETPNSMCFLTLRKA